MPTHLPSAGGLNDLLRRACAELRRRLEAGLPCQAESFLEALPALAADPVRAVELIVTEFLVRRELGEAPDPEEWLGRFPRWRDDLRRRFEMLRVLEGSTSGARNHEAKTRVQFKGRRPRPPACPGPGPGPYAVAELAAHEVLEPIGQGGMGVVYRARDPLLGREVAMKMLRSGLLASAEEVERFYREARAAAALRHPHVMPIWSLGLHDGQHCFTMPLVRGGSLAQRLADFQNDLRAAVGLMAKIARAVGAAHAAGIVHRDLKPGNVLLDEGGEPLVADFGLARLAGAAVEVTLPGQVMGTPAYMSPEQAAGHNDRVGPASDVWSLGVILYRLLTGQRPFPGRSSQELSRQILEDEPPRPRRLRPDLPGDLEAVVLKCLEKAPAQRYPTARELADDLERWLRGEAACAAG
jgi:serine/threonine-protein kinase